MSKWPFIDVARDRYGAPDPLLSEALISGRVGITAIILAGPRDWLQYLWIKAEQSEVNDFEPIPSPIHDLMPRATSIEFLNNNRIIVGLMDRLPGELITASHQFAATGQQTSIEVEHFVFGEVRVHEPSLLEELEARGWTGKPDPNIEEKKRQLAEWMEHEKRKHGEYPNLQFDKDGRMTVRKWAAKNGLSRELAERVARDLSQPRRGRRPANLIRQDLPR